MHSAEKIVDKPELCDSPEEAASPRCRWVSVFKTLALFGGLAACLWLAQTMDIGGLTEGDWVEKHVKGRGVVGGVMFVLLTGTLTAVGFPRHLFSFLGGYAFGVVQGSLWTVAGSALGMTLAFCYARMLGRSLVTKKFGSRVEAVNRFLANNPMRTSMCIRLMPVGSNLLTNVAAGVSSIGYGPFIIGSTLGCLPQTVTLALMGSGVRVDPGLRITTAVALFLLASWLGFHMYAKERAARKAASWSEENA